ncbi:MAG: hypothetical protein JW384_04239 [Nitrosomonadaceae bacterium]|nr:hypothetical protein [Nitrosomonadaceae bacterium]
MRAGDTWCMTKLQTEFAPHNQDDLVEGWDAVEEYINEAVLIAFDGCHKIYLAMDQEEAQFFRDNYNGEGCSDRNFTGSPSEMLEAIHGWWDESCGLRFVSAVWHNEADPNAGFVSLISQMAEDEVDEDASDDEDDEY